MTWGAASLALWLAAVPAVEPSSEQEPLVPAVEPSSEQESPALPQRRGRGFIGAAVGMHALSAVGALASFWTIDRRCLPSGLRGELDRGAECLSLNAESLSLTYAGTFAGRGAVAMAAVGGDHAGEYDGARDAWAQRPARADLHGLRVGGAVALGTGVAVMAAATVAQWVVLPRCESHTQWERFEQCVRSTLYAGWAADVVGGLSMSTGAGLLTYTSGYASAHRTWAARRRGVALKLVPRLSAGHLGLAAGLRF